MICKKCGATISDNEERCPYCGYTIYENAQKAYFQELDDICEDVKELEFIPQNEAKNSAKKMFRSILWMLAILFLALILYFVIYWRML